MKTLLSLFDYSGTWSDPFRASGWDVIQWDIKLDDFMDVKNIDSAEQALELFESVDGILAAPPCDHFTKSCAQWWPMKDADGRTAAAIELVRQVQKLADLFTPTDPEFEDGFFWVVENPVGRIPSLFPEFGQGLFFQPHEYAGYLEPTPDVYGRLFEIGLKKGLGVTKEETEFVVRWNAYKKQTGLWGDFNRNIPKRPLSAIRCAPSGGPTQRLGGKRSKTKEERSITPEGFALAFCEANQNWMGWRDRLLAEE